MPIIQQGHCAYSNSCLNVHSRHERLEGTNKEVCAVHYRVLHAQPAAAAVESTTFHAPRSARRRSWSLMVGAAGVSL